MNSIDMGDYISGLDLMLDTCPIYNGGACARDLQRRVSDIPVFDREEIGSEIPF